MRKQDDGTLRTEEVRTCFDEINLFTRRQSQASALSTTHSDIYKLERAAFERVVEQYPGLALMVADAAHATMKASTAALIAK